MRLQPSPKTRFAAAVTLATVLAVVGVGTLAVSGAQSAAAAPAVTPQVNPSPGSGNVTILSPAPFSYSWGTSLDVSGWADPGDVVTVETSYGESGEGPTCDATADGSGDWSCTLTGLELGTYYFRALTSSNDTAYQEVTIVQLPTIDGARTVDGELVYYDIATPDMPVLTGTAPPYAWVDVTIDGWNCYTTADWTGAWTCDFGADGGEGTPWPDAFVEGASYTASLVVNLSDSEEYSSPLDFTYYPRPTWFTAPANTRHGHASHDTAALRPTVTGHALTPFAQVSVGYGSTSKAFDHTNPTFHTYCNATANANGNWHCTPSLDLTAGQTYVLGPFQPRLISTAIVTGTLGSTVAHPASIPSDTYPTAQLVLHIAPAPVVVPAVIAPTPPPIDWSVVVTDDSGNDITGQPVVPGEHVVFTGDGVPDGTLVSAELHSTPIALGSVLVSSGGTYSIPAVVPTTVAPGTHEFVVTLSSSGTTEATKHLVAPVAAAPAPASTPTATPTPVPAASDGSSSGGPGLGSPSSFTNSLQTVQGIKWGSTELLATGAIGLSLLVLVALPAELLESTVRENYASIFGWLAPARRRFDALRKKVRAISLPPALTTFLMVLATSVILGYSSPDFGFNGMSFRLLLALFVSLFAVNVGVSAIVMWFAKKRYRLESSLTALPAAMLLALASVLLSRFLQIQPGLLFGVVLAVTFGVELTRQVDGKLALLTIGTTFGLGIAAWLGYSALAGAEGADPGFWYLLLRDTLVAVTVEALATLVISLLPLEFVDGKVIFDWSKWAWAITYFVAVVAFFVIVLPISDNWGELSAPLWGWGVFFLAFAALAVGVWAYFRFRKRTGSHTAE